MNCPYCNTEVPANREICPNNDCYRPLKPIPIPPNGKVQFGGYDWYVLEKQDGKMLLLTEKIIGRRAYHNRVENITWETCDMRKYLNGEFYNSFNETDRKRIVEVMNDNPANPWYGTSGGNPTTDKIFLLSIADVMKYFGDTGQCENRPKEEPCDWCNDEYWPWLGDEYNINRRAVDDTGMVMSWRLRSPGANGRCVAFVMGNCWDEWEHGGIGMAGGGGELTPEKLFVFDNTDTLTMSDNDNNINGVRPALWLRTEDK